MFNPFPFSIANKRYHTWDYYLKQKFGFKVGRVSLNAKFSCPNIDGTKGTGGCTFCRTGSADSFLPLDDQYFDQLQMIESKWNTKKHFTYFQAFTNTHGPIEKIQETIEPFIEKRDSVGIIIGTRADCLSDDVVKYLVSIQERTELWVELGLQTSNDETAKTINRCHTFQDFKDGVAKLRAHNINVSVHLINSLPGETKEDMVKTVKDVCECDIQAIKIHMLSVVKDTAMAEQKDIELLTEHQYVDIVLEQLRNIPSHIIVQRLTGDPDHDALIEPHWVLNKMNVLNHIDMALDSLNMWQGKDIEKQLSPTVLKVHELIDRYSDHYETAVDLTLGNGFDTLFMASRFRDVVAFEIQDIGIERSKKRLRDFDNITIIKDSHANILKHIDNCGFAVMNTGYLPGSDKKITTNARDSLRAILDTYKILNDKSFMLIAVYRGHDNGAEYNRIIQGLGPIKYEIIDEEKKENSPLIIKIRKY